MRRFGALLALSLAFAAACGGNHPAPAPSPIVIPPPADPVPPPEPPPPPPTLGVTRILAFGDSMTFGRTEPPVSSLRPLDAGMSQSYPYKLQTLFEKRYTAQSIQVFNLGIPGNLASQDRERFSREISNTKPEVALLLEGANDLNQPFAAGEGVNERISKTVAALEDMVRDAGFRGLTVFLGTLPPQRPGGSRAGAASFLTRFNDAVEAMAQKKGAQIVDFESQLPLSLIGADGLHPTEEGYQRMAEIWLEALKTRYEHAP
jgi:lysophospholipase L1-like esterase